MERSYANFEVNHRKMNDDHDGEKTIHKKDSLKDQFQVYEYPLAPSESIHDEDDNNVEKIPLTKKESDQRHRSFTSKITSSAAAPFRSFRKSLSRKQHSTSMSTPSGPQPAFEMELQEAHRQWQRKQKYFLDSEEKKDDSPSFHLQEEEPQYYPPPPGFEHAFVCNTMSNKRVDESEEEDNDGLKTYSQLQFEKLKNLALKEKLDETESQLRAVKESRSNEYLDHYTRQIRKLQQEVSFYQNLALEERRQKEVVEDKFTSLQREHSKLKDRMKVLIFKEIPYFSAKFKDIGSVDHSIVETHSSVANYDIGDVLGRGQYGAVKRAVRRTTSTSRGGNFAVKIIKKEGQTLRYKDLEGLAVEVAILAGKYHPNIIHLEEVIHATENIYLVTEIAATDVFRHYRECGGLSEPCVKNVAVGMLLPLNELHENGICHMDLKPENILLKSTGECISYKDIRLADFGLARMNSKTSAGRDVIVKDTCCGTLGFFAPEMMFSDNSFVGQRADMWSMGCLLLELAFEFSQEWLHAYEQAQNNPEACINGLQACVEKLVLDHGHRCGDLVDFLSHCLAIEPSERMTAAEALQHPWLKDVVTPEMLQYIQQ